MDRAQQRLQHLRDISGLLTRVPSVEHTLPELIGILTQALPLRSAILILETAGRTQTIVWPSGTESARALERAKAHAQAAYRSLVRTAVAFEGDHARTLEVPRPTADELQAAARASFVLLPLVVDHGSIFGAFQLQAAGPLDELDLVFMNAVVNQLAVAIDRHVVITARQAATAAAEKEQRLLADVSAVLASSLESRKALSAVARFAVPVVADLCCVDVVGEEGSVERLEVLFADEQKQRELGERIGRPPPPGSPIDPASVIRSGEPLLLEDPTQLFPDGAGHEEQAEVLRAAGIRSMMVVPLVARGSRLGALTLGAAESGRRYGPRDLALAAEIAHRTAIALDNARLYEQAQRATRSREDLLSVVSHDLKNPLGVILMSLESIACDVAPDDDRRRWRKPLDAIANAARRMKRLIEDLLDAASIEAGHLSVAPARLEIAPLVSEAVESVQPLAARKSLSLESELPPELPEVWGDAPRLQQVLANLLGNAIKFTPQGGAIVVRVKPSADTVTFSVTDSGVGIAEDNLPRLFTRFWQVERTARLGTGLGLFIAKAIVDAHGGEIWVESKLGAGTTFFFTVRVAAWAD